MNKSVFITGASGGIGSAVAIRLAEDGFDVAAAYNSDKQGAEKLKAHIENLGKKCQIYQLDVSDSQEVNRVIEEATKEFGDFFALVNCAGIALQKLFNRTTDEDFEKLCSINFKGVFNTCRACVPTMLKHHKGKIINISSMWGTFGASCEVVYSATKAAVIGLTKALGRELAPSNIQVNCIAPGAISTKMNDILTEEEKEDFAKEIPMERFGLPEEIAGVVSFLASDDSSYTTSQVITVDGGLT